MEDVTDTVFRELIISRAHPGRLHVVFTEFTSVDGFLHDVGKERVRHRLRVSRGERTSLDLNGIRLVAQIWGSDPEKFYRASREISEKYAFDGIDINMGCPVKKIIRKSACSALILQPGLAKEIISATKEGSGLPVSVKTRIGFNEVITEEWIGHLLSVHPSAITVHGRTQKIQSEGQADWKEVRKAAELRNNAGSETLIVGNGDVSCISDGRDRARDYGVDGVMVGRGIFGNPAFFMNPDTLDQVQRIQLLKAHLRRYVEVWGGIKPYALLKRFFKIYLNSFEDVSLLRARMMETSSPEEGLQILEKFEMGMVLQTDRS